VPNRATKDAKELARKYAPEVMAELANACRADPRDMEEKRVPSTHPLNGDEVRALRQLRRDWPEGRQVFVTERGAPFTRSGFAKMIERAGKAVGFAFPVHMHMLRHACGYYYANRGEDTRSLQLWLGHKSIQHTVRYAELSADRFKDW
jgi:integrase